MTREQRTAMARIISNMIKADNIIEESEIKDMKKLMSDYGITHQEMSEARKIRFIRLFPLHNLKGCEFFPIVNIVAYTALFFIFAWQCCSLDAL